jgi:hypothetical protein
MSVGQPKEQILFGSGSQQRDRGNCPKRLQHRQDAIGDPRSSLSARGAFPNFGRTVAPAFGTDPTQHIPTVGGNRFRICRALTLPNPRYGPYVAKSLHLKGIPWLDSILICK